jgi:patatin-like phospholipase
VRTQAGPDGAWGGWQPIGHSATSNVAAVLTPNNALSVFVRGLDRAIWTKSYPLSSAGWSGPDEGWVSIGAPDKGVRFLGDPAVTRTAAGTRDVYCVGNDRHVYLNREVAGVNGYAWTGWHDLGGTVWTGVELRLATVSLETGVARYVDEAGCFTDRIEPVVDVGDATLASAAIPGIFDPVILNGQTYVDGGVRDAIPIWAAIDAGADVVFAIECSAPLVTALTDPDHRFHDPAVDIAATLDNGFASSATSLTDSGIVAIAFRSIMEVLPNSIVQNELEPRQAWPVPVYVIQPTWDVNDALTIDQGLIQIAAAYGWMRAADVLASDDPKSAIPTSDQIMLARRQSWAWESEAYTTIVGLENSSEPEQPNGWGDRSADQIQRAREAKTRVAAAVALRMNAGYDVPDGAENWASRWEVPGLNRFTTDPAAGFAFTKGNGTVRTVPPA